MSEYQNLNVYLSSTTRDLGAERKVITEVITLLGLKPMIFEEFSQYLDGNPLEQCREAVRQSDVFIGIYGGNYGWNIPQDYYGEGLTNGEISMVHLEYQWALEQKIPMLLFLKFPIPDEIVVTSQFENFLDELQSKHLVSRFNNLESLRLQIGAALTKLIQEKLFGASKASQLIFISHATLNDAFVYKLTDKLNLAGGQTWVDHTHILPGADWDTALESALAASKSLIAVLSPAALKSLVFKAEWSYFGELGKQIIPLIIEDVRVPFRLRILQYVDFRTDPDEGLKRLLAALNLSNNKVTWQ